jgi:CubicO group peptidase (beta-lactamase class C family)
MALRALSVVLITSLVAGGGMSTAADSRLDTAAIDAFVEAELDSHLAPGAALAIIHGPEVVYAHGYGDARAGQPATTRTQFAAASLSKGITAIAVMQLVESGAIDLDARVERYLPTFTIADSRSSRITVRHLLNHTSGLADSAFPHMTLPQPRSIKQRVDSMRSARLVSEPGSHFNYFDPNYAVLARLVEVVSGQPFDSYLANNVFEPLGMSSTVSVVTSRDFALRAPSLAQGHIGVFGASVAWGEADGYVAGSTGVVSTATDMAQYLMLHAGSHPAGDSVLTPDSVTQLHLPPDEPASGYAMGWFRLEEPGIGTVLHHNGVLGTFHADAVVVPAERLGIVLLYNSSHALATYDATSRGILRILRGEAPADGSIGAREVEMAFAGLTGITILWRGRTMARAVASRPRDRRFWLRGVLRVGWLLLPAALLLGLPQIVAATSGRVFSLGQIAAAMPGPSIFLLVNGVLGVAALAVDVARRQRGGPA